MIHSSDKPLVILGCDVAKETIVICNRSTGELKTIANRKQAIRRFLKLFQDENVFGICEATGGYESLLLEQFVRLGIAVHRADAVKVKAFIRSLGIQGKTDAIDARALADYGAERHARLALWHPNGKVRDQLQSLVLYRLDLIKQKGAEKNRLQAPKSQAIARIIRKHLRSLEACIQQVEQDIAALLGQDKEIEQTARVMRTIPGIGPVTASGLCALMPELGHMTRRQTASLVGLAPYPRESGELKGRRYTRGGRKEVRRLLFMAAMVAVRYNPTLREFYLRLIANGKRPIVALTASMRKLIVIINAKVRDEVFAKES